MSKTDIEEQAFDAANRIKLMIQETAPKDVVQLNEFILSVITEVLVDTVTASCEQLVAENARLSAACQPVTATLTLYDGDLLPASSVEVEAAAKAIYAGWEHQPGYLPWVDGGNSEKQCEARRLARKAIGGEHE